MPPNSGITWKWLTGILVTIILLLVAGWAASIRSSDVTLASDQKGLQEKVSKLEQDKADKEVVFRAIDKKADRTEVSEIKAQLVVIQADIKELLRRR
jgi:hypothetical protein